MNLDVAAVVARVRTMCSEIQGVATVAAPMPEPVPTRGLPLCVVEMHSPIADRHTYTQVKVQYTVQIVLLLGNADMTRERAAAAAAPFYERFVNKFFSDPKLGGTCDYSELEFGSTNFRTFGKKKVHPRMVWRLIVRHHGTPS